MGSRGEDIVGARALPTIRVLPSGYMAPEPLPTEPPGRTGGRPVCLLAWNVTQMEMGASEWQNVACQIKLGASELKTRIYFNQLGCSEGDEREGR